MIKGNHVLGERYGLVARFSQPVILSLLLVGLVQAAEFSGRDQEQTGMSVRHDSLPDPVIVHGAANIASAWLVYPTKQYPHAVLGDAVEASGVRVNLPTGKQFTLRLEDGSVFEDRYPRLLDVDGDGEDEIVLVRSYPDRGAALAILEVAETGLRVAAESQPIGRPYRWLNPVGAGDFDGDGEQEVAVILMPHLDGTLAIYRYDGERLNPVFRGGRFSNHAMGSRALGLSAVVDVNKDGRDEIIVPAFDRYSIAILALVDDQLEELDTIILDSPIVSDMQLDREEGVTLRFCLGNGECPDYRLTGRPGL